MPLQEATEQVGVIVTPSLQSPFKYHVKKQESCDYYHTHLFSGFPEVKLCETSPTALPHAKLAVTWMYCVLTNCGYPYCPVQATWAHFRPINGQQPTVRTVLRRYTP